MISFKPHFPEAVIMEQYLENLPDILSDFGVNIISAIAVFIIGRYAAVLIKKFFNRVISARKVEQTIAKFATNFFYYTLMAFVILATLDRLGIETMSFVAVLGAAGLAVGLALQGSLANFAAGFLLIILRPIKVGDYIEGAGTAGVVDKIQIFTTELLTPDNKKVIIPNAKLYSDNIVNYSAKEIRRVDLVFGVSYSDDLDKVRRVIVDVLKGNERILSEPEPTIGILAPCRQQCEFRGPPVGENFGLLERVFRY